MKKLLITLFVLCLCVSVFGQFIPIKMFGQQPSGPFADGLVFYFRGIEAGNAVDESFFGNHGTITGATWVGNGLNFDGSGGSNIDLTENINLGTDPFTWIVHGNYDSSGEANAARLINALAATYLEFSTVFPKIRMNVNYSGQDGTWATDVNVFSFGSDVVFALVWNGENTNPTFYIDGQNVAMPLTSAVPSGSQTSINSIFRIGNNIPSNVREVDGTVFDVKIYDRALSADEIFSLFINPDLPMQREPIWLLQPPPAAVTGQVIIIAKHEKESVISTLLTLCQCISLLV